MTLGNWNGLRWRWADSDLLPRPLLASTRATILFKMFSMHKEKDKDKEKHRDKDKEVGGF